MKKILTILLMALLLAGIQPAPRVSAASQPALPSRPRLEVTAYDLIAATNTLRISYGNPPLIEDPIINAVAQATADYMAANQMSWHIGDVSGRIQSAGYGGGAKVWATENFAVGSSHSIDTIMMVWADESHMIPVVNAAYCHVGAGVAQSSNGMTYYVLQAAYTSANACGEYTSPVGRLTPSSGGTAAPSVSQLIVPVAIATPGPDGKIFHEVKSGQSFWSIAIAYKVTINDIATWNNISKDARLQIGQKLFIPSANTEGYATPTPVGMIVPSTPQPDGRILHTVQAYNTLTTIAEAYDVEITEILALNGLQEDWPLQIGQQILIRGPLVTPSPTPLPLTPLQKLTPAEDGKYYHNVSSGETLSYIADLYAIQVADLMAWNGLIDSTILPGQKLILQITPPATDTPTPGPPTATPSPTRVPPTATPSRAPTLAPSFTATPEPGLLSGGELPLAGGIIFIAGVVGLLLTLIGRRRR